MIRTGLSARASLGARSWVLAAVAALSVSAGVACALKGNDMPEPKEAALPLAAVQGIRIDEPTMAVPLPLDRSGKNAERLRQALAPAGRARLELVLDEITVAKPPGVQLNVYLSTTGPAPRREYVGTLSFFGVGYRTGTGALPRRVFEVGRELRALAGGRRELPGLQVVFEATEGDAGSMPEAARAQFNRAAGLRIGSLQLRVQGEP